ncbi:hypothetical protein AB1Y20_005885 [Prymnesium parvum]|uniref:Derlin n=1 Tax=Prymnesium parvum TaxID=97485 RepID=A0AB34J297_PRYPA
MNRMMIAHVEVTTESDHSFRFDRSSLAVCHFSRESSICHRTVHTPSAPPSELAVVQRPTPSPHMSAPRSAARPASAASLLLCALLLPHAAARARPSAKLSPVLRVDDPRAPRGAVTTERRGLASLVRLRGGDGSSMIEGLKNSYLAVPPLTRTWFTAIIAFSGLTHVGLLNAEALGLDAGRTVYGLQLWRPLTAASYFGGLTAQLLSKMYYLVTFGKELETLLGIGEFCRTLVSCAAMLSLVFHVLGWPYTGDGLVMALTVLCCQQNPDAPFSFYGLKFAYQFLPIAQLVLSYLFSQQIPWQDMVGLVVGYLHYYINDEVKPDAALAKKLVKPGQQARSGRTLGGSGGGDDGKKRKSRIVTLSDSGLGAQQPKTLPGGGPPCGAGG